MASKGIAQKHDYAWIRQQILEKASNKPVDINKVSNVVYRCLLSNNENDVVHVELLEELGYEQTHLVETLLEKRLNIQRFEEERQKIKQQRKNLRLQGSSSLGGKRPANQLSRGSAQTSHQNMPAFSSQSASRFEYESIPQSSNSGRSRQQQSQSARNPQKPSGNNLFHGSNALNKYVFVSTGNETLNLTEQIKQAREKVASSVAQFNFALGRTNILSSSKKVPSGSHGVVYWMSRDQRVQDNWALLYAQKLALDDQVPLHVVFCLVPKFLAAPYRMFDFMLKGLAGVNQECKELSISFHLLRGHAADVLPSFVSDNQLGAVVTDFAPLRTPRQWVQDVKCRLPEDVLFVQVDAHNVVPCWEASHQAEEAAYLMRERLTAHVASYMTEFPPVVPHPHRARTQCQEVDWEAADASLEVDRSVGPVTWATPGTCGGIKELESFVKHRLCRYKADRNIPTTNAVSNLSPWFHFGQVSVQRALLVVNQYAADHPGDVDKFFHEALIWRELAENFCYHNSNYDNWEGCPLWAQQTWDAHRHDRREYVYSREQLEKAQTHDDLWNAAQIQMIEEGKMHGFLRMYWAKKIMEWTENPERALADTIYLNDKYSLDGRDSNGYAGIMWAICGVHDHEFQERKITGKVRCMTYFGCTRKFDVHKFIRRYNAKKQVNGPMDKFLKSQ